MPKPDTTSQELEQILTTLENHVASDVTKRIVAHTSATSPKARHLEAMQAITKLFDTYASQREVVAEIKGKLLALDKMIMGAGEYHDDPYEYVVPLRHIRQYRSELNKFGLSQPIFRDKTQESEAQDE